MSSLLNIDTIRSHITNPSIRQLPIDLFTIIPSTHDYFKDPSLHENLPRVCLAEQQTQGRGQHQKTWYSPPAVNLYFTALWSFTCDLRHLQGLSLAVGLSTLKAIQRYGVAHDLQLKWPNDVYHQGQKLVGILIETETRAEDVLAIISMGININQDPAAADQSIHQPWTSLKKIIGAEQDRNKMAGLLIDQLATDLAQFLQKGWAVFLPEWFQNDFLLGKPITIKDTQGEHQGVSQGVDTAGRLLLRADNGEINAYATGQIMK